MDNMTKDFWEGVVYALEYLYEEENLEEVFDTTLAGKAKEMLGKDYYENHI